MNVSQLIEKLQRLPGDLPVVMPWGYDYGGLTDIDDVTIDLIVEGRGYMDKAANCYNQETKARSKKAVILE